MDKKENKPCIGTPKALFGEGSEPEGGEEFPLFEFFFFKSQTIFLSFRLKISSGGTRVKRLFRVGVFIQRKISFGKKYNKKKVGLWI